MESLTEINEKQIFLTLPILKEKVADYARNAFAKNTILNYESDWKNFAAWCKSLNIDPLNSTHNTLIAYITLLAEQKYKASTIQRKISGIIKYSEIKYSETKNIHINIQNKEFKIVWQGIRRKLGILKQGKDPILLETLEIMLKHIPLNSSMGIRDRALLSLGWFSAMRRSEIVSLNWQDLSFIEEGVLINIRQSKTDRYSEGQKIAILKREHPCSIKYLKAWREINDHEPVFCSLTKNSKITGTRLSSIDVARIVKKWSALIGLDTKRVAGHSLRRGFVTTAVNYGIRNHIIMKTTRHKSSKMIDDYTSDKSLIKNNASNMMSTQKPATIMNTFTSALNYITTKVFKTKNRHA